MFGEENKKKDKMGLTCLIKHEASQIKKYYEFADDYIDDEEIQKVLNVFIEEQTKRISALSTLLTKNKKDE